MSAHTPDYDVTLTDAERDALAAGWPDFWQVHAAVQRILADRLARVIPPVVGQP